MSSREIRITVPAHLYARIHKDARDAGNSLAATVRDILARYYRGQVSRMSVRLADTDEPESETPSLLT